MKQTRTLIDGAITGAIFSVILLIALYIPVIRFFLPLPVIYYGSKYGLKPSIVTILVCLMISLIIGGPIGSVYAAVFGIPGMIIGYLYHRQSPFISVMIGSSLAFIAMFIVLYIGLIVFVNINIFQQMNETLMQSMNLTEKIYSSYGNAQTIDFSSIKHLIGLIKYFTPTILVCTGIFTSIITLLVSHPILKRLRVPLVHWVPFRDWHFPNSILWYFLVSLLIVLFLNMKVGSPLFIIFYNLFFLLLVIMVIQGFSFVFHYSFYKKFHKSIPIIILICSFLIPYLMVFIVIPLGIIDIGFNLRGKLK